jgi:broad specificity phosphatase PhoE
VKFIATLLLAFAATSAHALATDAKAIAADLKSGGYVIVMRHGPTNPNQKDSDPQHLENIDRQRLLSDDGRRQAKQVGDAFRALGVPLGTIYTSKFNRAYETGQLIGGGDVRPTFDVTEIGPAFPQSENDRRSVALRMMIATAPPAGKNTLVVTHKPNIVQALGQDWSNVEEGEATIYRVDGGKPVLVGRVPAAEWIKAAGE